MRKVLKSEQIKKNNKSKGTKPAYQTTAVYKVDRSHELLEFLLAKGKTSRNNIKNLLSGKKVLVNGSVVSQFNFMLAKDDEIKIIKNDRTRNFGSEIIRNAQNDKTHTNCVQNDMTHKSNQTIRNSVHKDNNLGYYDKNKTNSDKYNSYFYDNNLGYADNFQKISNNKNNFKQANRTRKNLNTSNLPFKIIYEDENFIAIDKSFGLLSVESDKENVCAYGILFEFMQSLDKNLRPFILHRIDKETSGVLIFAKNIKIHSMLKMNWNNLVKTREYFAVVEGKLEKSAGTITSFLKENKNNLVYSTSDPNGQKAITHYKVEKENEHFSLLKVNIDTGRKNQIRVHMQDLKHPVVGDEKYGHKLNPLNRLGLHASKLEFINPLTKKLISISAPLPDSFRKLFK